MKIMGFLALTVALLMSIGCGQGQGDGYKKESIVAVIPDAGIEALAGKKVLFAHMSVGNDILNGIREGQAEDRRLQLLKIIEFKPGSDVKEPGIYHLMLGNNSFPDRKIAACENVLFSDETGGQFEILVFKYCYVDFASGTDVDAIFSQYKDFVDRVRQRFPNLKIVHVTVPLTVKYMGLKSWVKFLLSSSHSNLQRNQFNQRLIKEFEGTDFMYDLAGVESTDNTGRYLTFKAHGQEIPYLAKEYTLDGGHLNRLGRKKASWEFIRVLAGVH